MKKIALVLLAFLTLNNFLFAAIVSVSDAKMVGYHYLVQHGAGISNKADLQLSYTSGTPVANFYVFSTGNSFVIVSADDVVEPILGYSKNRPFAGTNISPNVLSFIDGYAQQIAYAKANGAIATEEIAEKWYNLKNDIESIGAKTTAVSPLLTTTWNQSPYYNDQCPYDYPASARTVTGCVATAMAQVMKFWNYPANGTGMHSYSSSYGLLSANFGSTTYNWGAMPNNVTGPNAAVATLMYQVGVSVDMDYGISSAGGSGAYVISSASPVTHCTEYALKTYFGYKPTLNGISRSSYSDASWISTIETELNAGRPVVYAGFGSSGGHCFDVDGYDPSDNFHINWGWGGAGPDGYYYMNSLNPPALGIGGGGGGFNANQQAVIGIQPNVTTATSLQLFDYVTPSASSIFYYNPFTVHTDIINSGTTAFSGTFCAAAFNSFGSFVTFIDSITGVSLPAGYHYTSGITFSTSGLLSMLPGNYTIGIYYHVPGGGYIAVSDNGSYTNVAPIAVVNHNYMELYAAMTPTPSQFVSGAPGSVGLNIRNFSGSGFSGDYDVSLYNLDGTFNCSIEQKTGMSLGSYASHPGGLTFSTSNVTAPPGTYFLALQFHNGTAWYRAGADYFLNPVYMTVVAPPLSPDIYEMNNTSGTAYNLPLTWVSDAAVKVTTGSNFHTGTDEDYYKIVLAPGYSYTFSARVNDIVSADDAVIYSTDAVWTYSTDGGSSWSPVYNNTMPATVTLPGTSGATVIFHVSHALAGSTGTYVFKISNITRTVPSCDPPSLLAATSVTTNSATLNWSPPATGLAAVSYTVEYRQSGTSAWTSIVSSGTSQGISGLSPATNYEYQVRTNCTGSGTSSFTGIGNFTTLGLPCSTPASFTIANITGTSATISWSAITGAVSYNIQYRLAGLTAWTTTTSPANSVILTGLMEGKTYEYQVQSVCPGSLVSSYSGIGSFVTICPVAAGLSSTERTLNSVTLTWLNVTGSSIYTIQYRIAGTATWSTETVATNPVVIQGLQPGTMYEFSVQTVCGLTSTSSYSDIITVTTVCPEPGTSVVENITFTTATINWTDSAGISNYAIQYRPTGTTTWSDAVVSTTKPLVLLHLSPLTAYEYQLQSICTDSGKSTFVNGNFTTTGAKPDIYPNPSKGLFTVELNSISNTSIAVYNTLGKLIYTASVSDNKTIVDLSNFASGVYFIHVDGPGNSSVKKVVLSR